MEREGLAEVADAIRELARAVRDLGNGNASTQMGAIEAFSVVFRAAMESLASQVAEALKEAGENVAGPLP